jgi:hypothetical protein
MHDGFDTIKLDIFLLYNQEFDISFDFAVFGFFNMKYHYFLILKLLRAQRFVFKCRYRRIRDEVYIYLL